MREDITSTSKIKRKKKKSWAASISTQTSIVNVILDIPRPAALGYVTGDILSLVSIQPKSLSDYYYN